LTKVERKLEIFKLNEVNNNGVLLSHFCRLLLSQSLLMLMVLKYPNYSIGYRAVQSFFFL
jgi:hypothetical protein